MEQYFKELLKKLMSLDKKIRELDRLSIEARKEIFDLSWIIFEKRKDKKIDVASIKKI